MLPNAFAKQLGARVWLNRQITSIQNLSDKVVVHYNENKEAKTIEADYYVNCIPPPAFNKLPVEPAFTNEKQYALDNITYDSYQRFVFQASSKFWLEDGFETINMELGHPDLWSSGKGLDQAKICSYL